MLNILGWFLVLALAGVPIAFVLGVSATLYLVFVADVPLRIVPQRLFSGIDSFVLMSIPFFVLAGFLMNEAQLTARLINFANFLVGRWRGGLAQVTVVASMFFGGISGAAAAESAALGAILIPAMEKEGYKRDFATAVVVAASLCGPLIPPSIPMLVYGVSSGASIGDLFLAGATPGVAVGVSFLLLNRYLLRRMPTGAERAAITGVRMEGFFTSLRGGLVALAMPAIILGGVIGGIVTPTESSAVAVFYAILVGLAMRTLKPSGTYQCFATAALLSATILLIVGCASVLGWVLAAEQIPEAVARFFLSLTDSPGVFLLLVVVLLLVVGLFMETSAAIIILTPVLLPAARDYGISELHFGVVMVFALVIGLLTPPVGLCLFIGSSIGKVPVHVLTRALLPYLGVLVLLCLVFTYFPYTALWLPDLVKR
ncbi:MAG: TRAP transporter large permease [Burkholderiales bacterium]|nr:TRAP transporter large permease [Burkholderiales bacterium]